MRNTKSFFIIASCAIGFVLVISILAWTFRAALIKKPLGSPAVSANYFVTGCSVLDTFGMVYRRYPGAFCLFLDDGRFLSSDFEPRELRMYSPDMKVLWRKKIDVHHQINLTLDKKHFLFGSSSLHQFQGKKVRFDQFIKMDFDGNVVGLFDFFAHQKEFEEMRAPMEFYAGPLEASNRPYQGAEAEYSHLNSFYEIQPNASEQKIPALKAGGFVLHDNLLQYIFVIDPEMKSILWSVPHVGRLLIAASYHDVQMQADGKFLIYNNRSIESNGLYGSIDEYDPVLDRRTVLYQGSPPSSFAPRWCGGVQRLPGGQMLISDVSAQLGGAFAFIIDAQGKTLQKISSPFKTQDGKADDFQQIKAVDLTAFLKNNKFL